jgi:hypothetical protein
VERVKRAITPVAAVMLGILCLAGCGGSSSSAPFPPKTESDLHALAKESTSSVTVVGHDQTSAPPSAVLFVVMPRSLSDREQVSALLKVLYDKHLDAKVGHQIGSAVVLGYRTSKDVGNRFNAGRVEIDAAKGGRKNVILDAGSGGQGKAWRLSY